MFDIITNIYIYYFDSFIIHDIFIAKDKVSKHTKKTKRKNKINIAHLSLNDLRRYKTFFLASCLTWPLGQLRGRVPLSIQIYTYFWQFYLSWSNFFADIAFWSNLHTKDFAFFDFVWYFCSFLTNFKLCTKIFCSE